MIDALSFFGSALLRGIRADLPAPVAGKHGMWREIGEAEAGVAQPGAALARLDDRDLAASASHAGGDPDLFATRDLQLSPG
jgi:hypothetical protein